MTRTPQRRDHGFTLVELLVVVVIIGILAGVAIPVFLNQKAKANEAAVKAQASDVAKAVETLFTDDPGTVTGDSDTGAVAIASSTHKVATTNGVSWIADGNAQGYCIAAWSTNGKYTASDPLLYDSTKGGLLPDGEDCASGPIDTSGLGGGGGTPAAPSPVLGTIHTPIDVPGAGNFNLTAGLSVDETRNLLIVPLYNSNAVALIDGATNSVATTVPVAAAAAQSAVDPSAGLAYVVLGNNPASIATINLATRAVTNTISVPPGFNTPTAAAIDTNDGTLLIQWQQYLGKYDPATGAQLAIADLPSFGTAGRRIMFDAASNTVFAGKNSQVVALDAATLSIKWTAAPAISTDNFANFTIDAATGTLWTFTANHAVALNPADGTVLYAENVGGINGGLERSPDGKTLYVVRNGVATTWDTTARTYSSTVSLPAGGSFAASAFNRATNTLYVLRTDQKVAVFTE